MLPCWPVLLVCAAPAQAKASMRLVATQDQAGVGWQWPAGHVPACGVSTLRITASAVQAGGRPSAKSEWGLGSREDWRRRRTAGGRPAASGWRAAGEEGWTAAGGSLG